MSKTIFKYFIVTALFFFLVGCIEGIMFPVKFRFQEFFSAMLDLPADQIKPYFGYFVAKIHTHVSLVGWVGSALMGILYFIAPQIGGADRTRPWAAWGNWIGNTLGVILMVVGFHMIGITGLSAGYSIGTPEFRAVASSYKVFVAAGGILITLSTVLFIYNMLVNLSGAGKSPTLRKPNAAGAAALLLFLALLTAGAFPRNVAASPSAAPDLAEVIMIGDRLVDVAYSLDVVPAAMSLRCSLWPMCETLKSAVQVLGCPNHVTKKEAAPVLEFAAAHGIKRVLIEKNDAFCAYVPDLKMEALVPFLEKGGLEAIFVNFNSGIETAVRETAKVLGRTDRVEAVLADYQEALDKTREKMAGKTFAKRVVILKGTYQTETGKAFVQVEAPGGYSDMFLLSETGSKNVGDLLVGKDAEPAKGHYTIRKLDALIEAAPDVIVMTGDALAVQKVLSGAIMNNPALAQVPAVKAHAVYSLPAYIDSGVIEYPMILRTWADVLSK